MELAAKHLKGFAVLWCIWSKKHKGSYANMLLCVLFFGVYSLSRLRHILQLRGAEVNLKIERDQVYYTK